jgi:hypothetical protein
LQELQLAALTDLSDQFERAMETRLDIVLQRFSDRLQSELDEETPRHDGNGEGTPIITRPEEPAQSMSPGGGSAARGFWERYGFA